MNHPVQNPLFITCLPGSVAQPLFSGFMGIINAHYDYE